MTETQSISTRTSTGPDIWKWHQADLNHGLALGCPAELLAALSLEIWQTERFQTGRFWVEKQSWAILYHLIILTCLGCLTFFSWMTPMQLASGYKFRLIWYRTEKKTRDSSRDFSPSYSIILHLYQFLGLSMWFCGSIGLSCTRNLTRLLCWSIVVRNSNCWNRMGSGSLYDY